ncbi:hypothetical protein C0J52_07326 [Blattella germanica]|nr:hypothetical protein C0J52_07326 [Blattella germanica]
MKSKGGADLMIPPRHRPFFGTEEPPPREDGGPMYQYELYHETTANDGVTFVERQLNRASYIKEVPVEVPELSKIPDLCYTTKNYWNKGVMTSFYIEMKYVCLNYENCYDPIIFRFYVEIEITDFTEEVIATPQDISEVAFKAKQDLLPDKSRKGYEREYLLFRTWCTKKNVPTESSGESIECQFI